MSKLLGTAILIALFSLTLTPAIILAQNPPPIPVPEPPDPCPTFVSFNPPETQFTPDQQIGIIFQPPTEVGHNVLEYDLRLNTQVRRVEIIPVTFGTLLWTATIGPLPVSSQDYNLHLEKSSPPQKDCGTFSFSVVNASPTPIGLPAPNPCASGTCNTALGNIPTDITGFAGKVLSIAIGLAGGIALILLVFGSIRVLTSSGDQQRLSGGRDTIVAAIAGLLFLIFSVLILKAVGVAIGIPL